MHLDFIDRLGLTRAAIPGIALCAGLALAAIAVSRAFTLFPISPMIIAVTIAMAIAGVAGKLAFAGPGNAFVLRRLLRLAIVLLGLQLTLGDIAALGAPAVTLVLAALVATFFFTIWFGRLIGAPQPLTQLLAAGTAICGASAIVAANSVTRASHSDAVYAVVIVTFFGTIFMFAFPALYQLLPLSAQQYGVWTGGALHEVAQAVAAGFQAGQSEGQTAMVAKLLRVAAMAPMIALLGYAAVKRSGAAGAERPPLPWFVAGFLALVIINSLVAIPQSVRAGAQLTSIFLLTMSLAALGLETQWSKLREGGLKPLALGAAASVFIGVLCLAGVMVIG